jgi:hypothetical protein
MSNVITETDGLPPPPAPGTADAIDEALVGLPAPPRVRTRVLGVLLTAISALSLFLAWQLRDDVRYAFAPSTVIELSDGRTAAVGHLGPNRLVRIHATPQMAGAVRYTRPIFPGEHTVFPVAGRAGDALYVQTDGDVAQGEFVGRLIPFAGAGGRYARVGHFIRDEFSAAVTGQTWLIVDGATPRTLWWAPVVASFLIALALSDLFLLFRLFRPIK